MDGHDIEIGVTKSASVRYSESKIVLVLRRICHIIFMLHHLGICGAGSFVFYNALVSEVDAIRAMGQFGPAFGTNWNFAFQTSFLFLALAYDVLEWMNKQETPRAKKIAYWRDVIFNSLVVPFTLFVACMFWCIYWIDRELVFPEVYDSIVPWWFNHCVHTNITIVILVETLLQARRQPTNFKLELWLNSIVAFGYAVVYYSIYYFCNRWLYNVFGVMTWWQVCLYQLLIWSSTYFFYFIHFPINRLIHGKEPEEEKTVEEKVPAPVEETRPIEKLPNGIAKSFEISAMQTNGTEFSSEPFSSDNWSLKYRSLRDKFENSRL